MNIQDWDVELTPEEQLALETEARKFFHEEDKEHVARVCGNLYKQCQYQSRMLERAANHIGYLEMEIDTIKKKDLRSI